MSEMLANRYFLAGRFGDAAVHFEAVLRKHADHVQARKKLVICYAVVGRLREALELTVGLLSERPDAFLQTDPEAEGYPCDRLRALLKPSDPKEPDPESHVARGLLSLFCDESSALREFGIALSERVEFGELHVVHGLVRKHMEAGHVG